MINFRSQRIIRAVGLGEKLKEAREDQNISLAQAARSLNIPFKYLEALEENRLSSIPGELYAKNFLTAYCRFLKLDFNDCWQAAKKLPGAQSRGIKIAEQKYFGRLPEFLRRLPVAILILAILFFLLLSVQKIFLPPPLAIDYPTDGLKTAERQIRVVGRSDPEVDIVLNNRNILVDNQGRFEAQVDLQKGLNLIKITAKKRYSRPNEIDLKVLLTD